MDWMINFYHLWWIFIQGVIYVLGVLNMRFMYIETNKVSVCYRYEKFYLRYNLGERSKTIKRYMRGDNHGYHGCQYLYKRHKFYWNGDKLL